MITSKPVATPGYQQIRLGYGTLVAIRACCIMWAVAGCVTEPPLPRKSDRLIVALDTPPKQLDPRFATDAASMRVSRLIFQSLVSVDNEDLVPKAELATRWIQNEDDPREWTIFLKRDVRWHDGTPFSAKDVVYTYESVMAPDAQSPFAESYQAHFESITALTPHSLKIRLKAPYATFLTDLVLGIVPQHVLEPHAGRFIDDGYIGTGPYRFHARHGDRRLDLRAADETTTGAPHLVFQVIRDEGTRLLAMLGGQIDLAQNGFSPVLTGVIEKQPDLVVDSAPSIAFTYLALNLSHSALADVRVRRALAYAIPRQRIIDNHLAGRAQLASGMLSPMHWAYEPGATKYEFDPEYAKQLLAEAGHGPDGVPLSIQIKISTDRFRRTLARTIAAAWQQVGVQTSVRSFEFGTFYADIKQGRFEAYMLDLPEPIEPDMYRWMLHSLSTPRKLATAGSEYARYDRRFIPPNLLTLTAERSRLCAGYRGMALRKGARNWVQLTFGNATPYSSANRMFYANPLVDCHLELALEPTERKDRIPHYHAVQRILADDLPVIPLWHPDVQITRRKDIVGYKALPNLRLGNLIKTKRQTPRRTQ